MSRQVVEAFQRQQLLILAGSPVGRSAMTKRVLEEGAKAERIKKDHEVQRAERQRKHALEQAQRQRRLNHELKIRGLD